MGGAEGSDRGETQEKNTQDDSARLANAALTFSALNARRSYVKVNMDLFIFYGEMRGQQIAVFNKVAIVIF